LLKDVRKVNGFVRLLFYEHLTAHDLTRHTKVNI